MPIIGFKFESLEAKRNNTNFGGEIKINSAPKINTVKEINIPSLKKKLQQGFGAKVFDHTGGGHAFHGISCDTDPYPGMHFVSPDHCVLELVNPESKEPVEMVDSAVGEMVFTFFVISSLTFMASAYIRIFLKNSKIGFTPWLL